MKPARVLLLVCAALAALYAACVLPSEPSGAERVQFSLDFALPYQLRLGATAGPRIRVLANGREVPYAEYRLETLAPSVVQVVGRDSMSPESRLLRGVKRGAGTVRVAYATGTGTPDTVFPVQVVISSISVRAALDTSLRGLTLTQLQQQRALTALAYDANNEGVPNVAFTWASSDTTIATVDATGRVTAEAEGTAKITAQADGVPGTAYVTVVQAARRVQVLPELDTLRTVSRTREFQAFAFDSSNAAMRPVKVTWRTTNPLVATVDTSGLAVAESAGTALIIAQVGPAADTAALIVKQVIRSVEITPDLDTLTAIDDTNRFLAQPQDSLGFDVPDAPAMTWATADPAIATVDQAGLVQARKNGLVLVTASTSSQSGSAVVLVRQVVTRAQIVEDSVALAAQGDTVRLSATALDRNGYPVAGATLTWRSAAPCVATVDTAALVTARHSGRTKIVATPADDTQADSAVVSVTGAPGLELIAFESAQGIEVMGAAGGCERTLLLANSYDDYSYRYTYELDPAWSPGSDRLAFTQSFVDYYGCYYGCSDLYTARADGSQAVNLTNRGSWDAHAAWSPDGTRIAFSSDRSGTQPDIHVMNADGSNVARVTQLGNAYSPTWSADGARIAFERDGEIYIINADGTGLVRLTTNGSYDGQPAWSPAGTQLAFVSQRDGNNDIWLMNPDGTGARNVTLSPVDEAQPAWSPTGSQLVMVKNNDLYLINVDGTGLLQMTSTDGYEFNPAWKR